MAFCEPPVTHGVITTHSPNFSPQCCEIAVVIPERAGFRCTAWSVVFRIEEQNKNPAIEVFKPAHLTVLIFESEARGCIANLQSHWIPALI